MFDASDALVLTLFGWVMVTVTVPVTGQELRRLTGSRREQPASLLSTVQYSVFSRYHAQQKQVYNARIEGGLVFHATLSLTRNVVYVMPLLTTLCFSKSCRRHIVAR